MKNYTINELAMMTGLTTRTLRNYIKMKILEGEKVDGVWRFTPEGISAFISHPAVKPSIQAKNKAIVLDFLAIDDKKENEICTILDLYADGAEADEVSEFFCNQINSYESGKIRFSYERHGRHVRVTLSGYEDVVMEILNAYYAQ